MSSLEAWWQMVICAPDHELLAFREADYLGLHHDENEHWRVPIVEDELLRRGLNVGSQRPRLARQSLNERG